ncbi:MAG: putative manganese-dependent inorganic diphosphatase [Lachnospiraceae bacterium]|nr:putative manganese-dependent inorganic diphosphatase [Lachnospiraceae bacterium]
MPDFNREVWVMGHKNPDTDSICSAICYANLKNKLEGNHFVPKKAGKINLETEFVLNYFGVEEPDLVFSVDVQVSDVDYRRTEAIAPDISVRKAWEIMKETGVVTLPVHRKKKLVGVITIQDIAGSYMEGDNRLLSLSGTTVKNILETLDGKLVVGDAKQLCPDGKVVIAAANPEIVEEYIEKGDIVILANRYETQLCALQMNAGMIINCLGVPIPATIKKMAEEKGCIIISTKSDTYTVARLINQSVPVEYLMTKENLVCFRTTDTVEEIQETMAKLRHRDFPILDSHGIYQGMLSRRNLLGAKKKQIILVDHNELRQACDGMENATILEILDHHRLGTIQTMGPIYFRNQPVGCTATIIFQMYQEEKVPIDKPIAGLLVSAIISDTLLFRSPTCTEYDKVAARKLAMIAGINLEKYARDMFTAGSEVSSKSGEAILHQDFKEFGMGEAHIGIGQINSMSKDELAGIRDKVNKYMPTALKKHGLDMIFFMMTSIMDEGTEVLFAGTGSEAVVDAAFGRDSEGRVYVPGMVSRKKQMVPAITQAMQETGNF